MFLLKKLMPCRANNFPIREVGLVLFGALLLRPLCSLTVVTSSESLEVASNTRT